MASAVQQLSQINRTLRTRSPSSVGTFAMPAAATSTISDTSVLANSAIMVMPTNAAAGTLQGSAKSLYISARSAGTSFTVATASGVAAAGTETFLYVVWNAL